MINWVNEEQRTNCSLNTVHVQVLKRTTKYTDARLKATKVKSSSIDHFVEKEENCTVFRCRKTVSSSSSWWLVQAIDIKYAPCNVSRNNHTRSQGKMYIVDGMCVAKIEIEWNIGVG